jgi:hypothetical protein
MANTFKNGVKASVTTVQTVYTCPGATTATVKPAPMSLPSWWLL